jgi:hypothetical protein
MILISVCSAFGAIRPETFRDVPFLSRDEVGARWTGMAGACVAIVDDGAAAYYNPAGLAKIRRIEILGSLRRQSLDIESEWYGRTNTGSVSATRIENLAVSYPFPTYRGSLVLTGSFFRPTSQRQYLDRRASSGGDSYQDIEERDVTLNAWSGALAVQVSPNVFVGGEAHFFTGNLTLDDTWIPWFDCTSVPARFDTRADLGGYGGTLGLIYVPHELVSFGVALRTPQRINVKGTEIWTDTLDCDMYRQAVDYDVDIPFSAAVGVGLSPSNFNIAVDVIFTDWQELKFPGRVRDPVTGDFLFDATADIRAGVEYTVPVFPARVRTGYAYVPVSLNIFEMVTERQRFSLGGGTIVEDAVTIDFAWQRDWFERRDPVASYSEKRTSDRLILGFAFRF